MHRIWLILFSLASFAADLVDVQYEPGETSQLRLVFDKPVEPKHHFSMQDPFKIILDFDGISLTSDKSKYRRSFDSSMLRRTNAIATKDKTRFVVDFAQDVHYTVESKGNEVVVEFTLLENTTKKSNMGKIVDVEFMRQDLDVGRVLVKLSEPNIPVDFFEEGQKVILNFAGAQLPDELVRRLKVNDFGTPIVAIDTLMQGGDAVAIIHMDGAFESMAYQADDTFVVQVRPLSNIEAQVKADRQVEYTGEKLSLNFQDIEIRSVLQLIAEFTGLNVVTSDSVNGNVTLRLKNVPWDQALDIILKTKGLSSRQFDNVLLIGPAEELAAREKVELETSQQVEELAPLRTEYMQVNYAQASDIAKLLKDEANVLISSRGNVSVDTRTNTLLVLDTAQKLDEIRALVRRLDVPVRQVLIESRIVVADETYEKALGVRFGLSANPEKPFKYNFAGTVDSGGAGGTSALATGTLPSDLSVPSRLNVSLPQTLDNGGLAGLGLTIGRLASDAIIDLELQALEAEGLGKTISSPRLLTSNQQTAYVENGIEIPFQEAASSGATSVSFKKAVLRLEVKPQITPDQSIILDLMINQDSRGQETVGAGPTINTRELKTQVLVRNGETIVLGGIYTRDLRNSVNKVPLLGDIPIFGRLFSNKSVFDERQEILVFITPKIVDGNVTLS